MSQTKEGTPKTKEGTPKTKKKLSNEYLLIDAADNGDLET